MKLIPVIDTYAGDTAATTVWETLRAHFGDVDGLAYYRHPNLGPGSGLSPDIALLAYGYGAICTKIIREDISNIEIEDDEVWKSSDQSFVSPFVELEDLKTHIEYRFNQHRSLRNIIEVSMVFSWPSCLKRDFVAKFGPLPSGFYFIWKDSDSNELPSSGVNLDDDKWRLAKSVFQNVNPLNKGSLIKLEQSEKKGTAIRILERDIALLDDQQSKVAFQIPPGPQRIRGLAGTGKTVLLAMKAATIHSHFPDCKILFTFNTQSLYNQAIELIIRFYQVNKPNSPVWNNLHIRHAWGSSRKSGVYSDLCARQGINTLDFRQAKTADPKNPFRACCDEALRYDILPQYDYILVDEAQDFPAEFFRLLYKLAKDPKRIYFAFDELQSLSSTEIPNSEDLFGVDDEGKPLVNLDGHYPGDMEKDLVLHKSYRCPHQVLMLAHGIGLGIHNKTGCVQMISSIATWHAIGYQVTSGQLQTGQDVEIQRPQENSPNRIADIYTGGTDIIRTNRFEDREEEIKWLASQIASDINDDNVAPEHIIVISLNSLKAKNYMSNLQGYLYEYGIASVVPGLSDYADEFGVEGKVTLSTVYRAKGNEAPIIYIMSFNSLYDYIQEVEFRNRAFTSLSRSKGWVTISGVGKAMDDAINEIRRIIANIPSFRFTFPDMTKIKRNLDAAETLRRRQEVKTAAKSIKELADVDLGALSQIDQDQLEAVYEKLKKIKGLQGEPD